MSTVNIFKDAVEHLNGSQEALRKQVEGVLGSTKSSSFQSLSSSNLAPTTTNLFNRTLFDYVDVPPEAQSLLNSLHEDLETQYRDFEPPSAEMFADSDNEDNILEDGTLSPQSPPLYSIRPSSPTSELERLSLDSLHDHITTLSEKITELLDQSHLSPSLMSSASSILNASIDPTDHTLLRNYCSELETLYSLCYTRISIVTSYTEFNALTEEVMASESCSVSFDELYNEALRLYSAVVTYERDFGHEFLLNEEKVGKKLEKICMGLSEGVHDDLGSSLALLKLNSEHSPMTSPSKRRPRPTILTPPKPKTPQLRSSPRKSPSKHWKPVNTNTGSPKADVLSKYNKFEAEPRWENTLRGSAKKSMKSAERDRIRRKTRPHLLTDQPISPVLERPSEVGRILEQTTQNRSRRFSKVSSPPPTEPSPLLSSPCLYSKSWSKPVEEKVSVPMPTVVETNSKSVDYGFTSMYPTVVDGDAGGDVNTSLERIRLLKSLIPK
ncbi:hypothetical protein GEMRC1_001861 [Eukaryota sp. GEM-RC1]